MAFSFLPSKSNSIQHKSVLVFWLLSIWCLEPETGGDVEVVGITCVAGCKIDITLTSYWFVAGGDWPGLIFSLICRELVRDGGTSGGREGWWVVRGIINNYHQKIVSCLPARSSLLVAPAVWCVRNVSVSLLRWGWYWGCWLWPAGGQRWN